MKPDLQARIDALFAEMADRPAPGCVLGVWREGEPAWTRAYGQASLELGVPLQPDSRLRIASVSKQFTVAAALLLERQGRLSQEDDIRLHLPELPELPQVVRVGHLMRNTSGLPDLLELLRLGGVQLDQRVSREQLLQVMLRNRHLNFAPGSRFLYCNSGFALLGLITERLSGRSLDAQLQQAFFEPCRWTPRAWWWRATCPCRAWPRPIWVTAVASGAAPSMASSMAARAAWCPAWKTCCAGPLSCWHRRAVWPIWPRPWRRACR